MNGPDSLFGFPPGTVRDWAVVLIVSVLAFAFLLLLLFALPLALRTVAGVLNTISREDRANRFEIRSSFLNALQECHESHTRDRKEQRDLERELSASLREFLAEIRADRKARESERREKDRPREKDRDTPGTAG